MVAKTSVRINVRLVDEAVKALGAKSRTEAVHMALRDIVLVQRFMKPRKRNADKLEFNLLRSKT